MSVAKQKLCKTRLLSRGELGESTYPEIVHFFFLSYMLFMFMSLFMCDNLYTKCNPKF